MRWNFSAKKNLPIAIAIGILLVVLVVKLKSSIRHDNVEPSGQLAQYEILKQQSVHPKITGYGKVKPNIQLNSLAEVTGTVTYLHPALKKGEIFKAETLLIKIDDSDYQLQLAKAKANLATTDVDLAAKRTAQENNKLDIKLSEHKLGIAESEFQRLQKLFDRSSVSQTELDKAKQNVLVQQQDLQRHMNQKRLIPLEIKALQAQVKKAQADVNKAELDIKRTEIRLPFTGRIHKVNVERSQLVTKGAALFSASDVEKVLINAQFTYSTFNQFSGFFKQKPSIENISNNGMATYLKAQELAASVEILSQKGAAWQASIERLSDEIDPQSQTIGVVVAIKNSYEQIKLGEKPPLLAGMRAKVSLTAAERDFVVVPRHAVRGKFALIADENDLLKKVDMQGAIKQGDSFLLEGDELEGVRLVTTDLFPAIEGTKLHFTQAPAQLSKVNAKELH
ncbi:hypothetical protein N474_02035 [Pseudoalteromonas luteoviolacea CPMOR-2]|uniref:Membrane fusion protein biotin-lipoyl like domain-containing protein n=1 Tax=Pseudoalteromonas luteoviolacea DSM 6061 TaxID=1365250 RepID=A0A166V328_9GAMM|nr:HlyD family secretion protein [Pseudoalteromonas luteoviolacea]KZN31664.1 hypothetical protein N475_04215 [Pseudoalteromonas luteoviolacea DSM 6061]KZN54524.1 hypothetical protein N474_02035 [Pseudoalteromonas luteoviolacea CPMOR-2]MBE0388999.1 hypothetical protein [Pseudoalteromonas luteoviolacea DSM 6061]